MSEDRDNSLDSIFQNKYVEFCDDLIGAYPEKDAAIRTARALTEAERLRRFRAEVLPSAGNPSRNPLETPGTVLPGVTIEAPHWAEFSDATKKAIQEYITLLSFCSMFNDASNPFMASDLSGNATSKKWMDDMLKSWRDKMSTVDFKSLTEKIMNIFGKGGSGSRLPFQLPESMLKGQLAKLAEELVREFKPEDFGLTPDQLEESDANPSRAFELLMNIYTQRPEILQNAMKRIGKRLQDKIRTGELKPQQIAAEAEQMIKEFSENPAFVELMESFRSAFGFEDPDIARSSGREGEGRLALARKRLREKADKKRKEAATANAGAGAPMASIGGNTLHTQSIDDILKNINSTEDKKSKKGGKGRK